jgi:hypothetical protein
MKSSAFAVCLTGGGVSLRRSWFRWPVVERVLELYRERAFDLNLRHFHEKLAGEHPITLSYSWAKGVLQGYSWAKGVLQKAQGSPRRQRGVHRKRASAAAPARHAA